MSFYHVNLAVFAAGNGLLLHRQYRTAKQVDAAEHKDHDAVEEEGILDRTCAQDEIQKFKIDFFLVYGLAVAADWLQGPHIYAIYKYEKNIPERMVAALYASGFISGAISASFAGQLADRFGRRLACLVYCASYILTCMSMFSDSFVVLFAGRFCGGISTTLLFSVFEAWLITEYHRRGLQSSGLTLSSIFGHMTTLSCIVAIVSGVVGDILVVQLGGRVWPFVASMVCSTGAGWSIWSRWTENYGVRSTNSGSLADIKTGLKSILANTRTLALGLTSCFFEGSMYLMIFFWSAALTSARARSGSHEELPFGLIFSSFMCAMMAGSSFFSLFSKKHDKETTSFILMSTILIVSTCLSASVIVENEYLLFWALCMFEACVGAYFPSMSYLKSEAVDDGVRGRVYSILRFPLNAFVVVAHSLDEEGDEHRNRVFLTCAALLMVAFFVVKRAFSE